ncbi:MAG: glycosyl transferase [Parcubacteria group bacterium]|nr:glycosyl transferase [Parcubacteria group bacterium]|tara:strand:+ start:116 stop:1078 length:963 start_codon:yes stop_codon:yes gene_type:complete
MSPKVFIIILNWNNWPDLQECLESLKDNDYPNYQIVIVDNGSEQKPELPNLDIKIIYNKENLGFSGGNNIGIRYALEQKTDYVLLLNNDTIVSKDFLSKLIKAGEGNKEFGILGPKIYFYEDKNRIWSAGGKINWLYNKGTMRGHDQIDQGQYDSPVISAKISQRRPASGMGGPASGWQETEYMTGCCLLIKRQVIETIGLMPEEYFLYYEDTDWSLKAKQAGFKCIFVPGAKIWHKISRSALAESSSYIYYHIRNGLILAKKYAPWYIKPCVHLDAIWRIKKQIFKLIFLSQKRAWAKYILLGIKDFYFNKTGKYENWH